MQSYNFTGRKMILPLLAPLIRSHIEAGTLLQPLGGLHHPVPVGIRTQVPMSAHPTDREILFQGTDQGPQGELLLLGSGIGRQAPLVQAPFVGYSDAFPVEAPGMCPDLFQGTGAPDEPVLPDVEVIPHHPHALRPMATEQVFLGEVHIRPGSRTVYHDQGDAACHPTHAVTPNAPAIPDATAMIIFKMITHTF